MDTVKSSSALKTTWQFADGDTRTVDILNPVSDVASKFPHFVNETVNREILIGDKSGAALTGVKVAKVVDTTTTALDF